MVKSPPGANARITVVYSLPETLAWGEERYQRMRREAEVEEPLDPGIFDRSAGDQEELIGILRSIMFDGRRISSVNVPARPLSGTC